ncbi:MAG: RES family NAD+ phosphorylase [Burkholderiales bacterium]
MAKRAATGASPTVPSKIKLTTWGSGQTMYRVHEATYAVDQFNPSPKGNARFSPILDPSGNVIPTLYAATTPRGALMESVFRDVPYRTGFKHVDAKRLEGRACSTLLFQTDFQLLDLSKVALRGLGIPPRQLIDTTKAHYPATRGWAEQVYAAHPHIQGFLWSSRQDDRALAVVLFGSRVKVSDLLDAKLSRPLIRNGTPEDFVLELATDLKVLLK